MGSKPRMGVHFRPVEPARGTAFAQFRFDPECLMINARLNLDESCVDPDLKRTNTGNGAELCR